MFLGVLINVLVFPKAKDMPTYKMRDPMTSKQIDELIQSTKVQLEAGAMTNEDFFGVVRKLYFSGMELEDIMKAFSKVKYQPFDEKLPAI